MPKDSIRTRVVTVDTMKYFLIPAETLCVQKIYLYVHKTA